MTILVTGSTGTIGSALIAKLALSGAKVRALTRNPEGRTFPAAVEVVQGDLNDLDTVRSALVGVSTLFLLVAVGPDELSQTTMAINLARDAGVERFVYLSVFDADRFPDVPHFSSKATVERMIATLGLSATILRPNYFMQNDTVLAKFIVDYGAYPMSVGDLGVSMVDVRDIVDAAASELLRRDSSPILLPAETYNLTGPDIITGEIAARMWSEALGKPVVYGGNDLDAKESQMRGSMPAWYAYDLRLMLRGFHEQGLRALPRDIDRLRQLLGREPRSYASFIGEQLAQWGS